jgi:glycosyltransferase involved in cell wall biosynthesis
MEDKNKVCLINVVGPHYRLPIYTLISREIGCDFYFGDHIKHLLKPLDYNKLNGFKKVLHNRFIGEFYWQTSAVRLLFKPYKYYLVAGEPFCLSSWVMLLLSKLTDKQIIAWTHGWYGRETSAKKMFKRFYFRLFDKLLVYSDYSIRLMEKEGFSRSKMFCIANSLDSDTEKQLRQKLSVSDIYTSHFGNDWPTVLYCGRVQQVKRLDLLIDSMAALKAKGINANIIVIGKDVDGVDLYKYAQKKGIADRLWMYGPCYDDKTLGQLFYNAAVCVSPGNVGLTAIHSLSFGCPVITHDDFCHQMPEFEAITPGATGDFYHYGDINDLAAKIATWVSKTPEERQATREAAFNEIDRKWNVHYQINIIKKVINEER